MTKHFLLLQGSRNPSRYSKGHTVPSLQGSICFLTEHQKGKTDQTMNKATRLLSQPWPVPWPRSVPWQWTSTAFLLQPWHWKTPKAQLFNPPTLKWGIIDFNLGLPWWLSGKESYNTGNSGSIPGSGRPPGEGKWQPTPVFLPRKFHEQKGARQAVVYGITKESDMTWRLNNKFQLGVLFFPELEKENLHLTVFKIQVPSTCKILKTCRFFFFLLLYFVWSNQGCHWQIL